ncbi:hypothetical protein D9M68_732640 [compost metagenome]
MVFGHFPDGQCLGLPGSDEISLEPFEPSEILFQFRLRDSRLRFSYECLNSLPVNGMPLAVFVAERSIENSFDVFHTFSGSVETRRWHPCPRARMPSGVGLKDAHGSRRRTCCKSAGFNLGAWPLCHPLQTAVRFLQLPLPTAPWPLLTLGLPGSFEPGGALGLPRFPRSPVGRLTDRWG